MELGKHIEILRKQRNWSQKDLAAALEETKKNVADWESGTSLPELDRLIHLSMLFEIPVEELAGEQAGQYELRGETDPVKEAEKQKKEKQLKILKLCGVLMLLLLFLLINYVWIKFLFRLIG